MEQHIENWFNLGFDSLQAITAIRMLKQSLDLPTLNPNVIYMHPTVTGLARALLHQDCEESIEAKNQGLSQERDELLQELIGQIEVPTAQCSEKGPDTRTVILTGSTGQLGTGYIYIRYTAKEPRSSHFQWILRVQRDIERVSQDKEELQIQLAKNPAAKVLDFFEDVMSHIEVTNLLDAKGTALISDKLRMVDAVKAEWIQWM
ncbi:acetyl-CoA synthetase-like protein [Penicillium sp. IBT 16267x]|nr:acetyl-CoA synthetase-like protein [Penicillium sp. IBT 16267x]